jgi:hypothetical protein
MSRTRVIRTPSGARGHMGATNTVTPDITGTGGRLRR